jgi:hypothetical protein
MAPCITRSIPADTCICDLWYAAAHLATIAGPGDRNLRPHQNHKIMRWLADIAVVRLLLYLLRRYEPTRYSI